MILRKNHHKENAWIYLLGALICGFLLMAFSSCSPTQKLDQAKRRFARIAVAYSDIPTQWAADHFKNPIIADSTEYKKGIAKLDSLQRAFFNDSLINDAERLALQVEIQNIKNNMPEPTTCDSLERVYKNTLARERLRGDKLQAAYDLLSSAARDLQPIHDTTVNDALVKARDIQINKLTDLLTAQTARGDKWESKSKKNFWIWIVLAVILAGVGFAKYKKLI